MSIANAAQPLAGRRVDISAEFVLIVHRKKIHQETLRAR